MDKEYEEEIPSEFIKIAWKVGQNGVIVADFIPKKNYKEKNVFQQKTELKNVFISSLVAERK